MGGFTVIIMQVSVQIGLNWNWPTGTELSNMGVKRCIRTSGMQTSAIKQLVNRFNVLNFQNADIQNFPLYFPKFPLYNGGTQWVAEIFSGES